MLKIELKPLKEWGEKDKSNGIRIYIGGVHIGTATPDRKHRIETGEELYYFDNNLSYPVCDVSNGKKTLVDIEIEIELSLKEFCKKILK